MKTNVLKKILLYTLSVFTILGIALGIHLYMVIKPKKVATENTIAMARFDFKQPINNSDAVRISNWLAAQPGVGNVLCNDSSGIAVFSFYPVKASADKILDQLVSSLNYKAVRFVPDEASIKSGCPAGY